eukprot:Rhum_TRINITY_DN14715_c2_g2::Rhum_TRINITY_DN14715_c2_g2_i1::g.111173::m.111173/K01809/manA, MPI; mannose-6-phosphate isomerase
MNVTYGVQSYAWGKIGGDSVVGKLKASSDKSFTAGASEPYAELWIGTHPKCPSTTGADGSTPLRSALDTDLPFLLKVLSIQKALSIQAHPTIAHAIELHARDPAHYPDPNHKPELLVALTPTSALACFRRPADLARFAAARPATLALLALPDGGDDKAGLRALMARLLSAEGAAAAAAHEACLRAETDAASLSKEDKMFLTLAEQFPQDSGALMVYVLNLISLEPGQAIFLKPNEPHAYLSGDGVEIMAKSDNVVRAGLTPKFKDAETLLGMMSYSPDAIDEMALPYDPAAQTQTYRPPAYVSEFQLTMTKLGGSGGHAPSATHTPATDCILLVAKGRVAYRSGGEEGTAVPGSAILVKKGVEIAVALEAEDNAAGTVIDGDAVLFFAEANGNAL